MVSVCQLGAQRAPALTSAGGMRHTESQSNLHEFLEAVISPCLVHHPAAALSQCLLHMNTKCSLSITYHPADPHND